MLRPMLLLVLLAACGAPPPPAPVLADPVTSEPVPPPAPEPTPAPAAEPVAAGAPNPALLNPSLATETAPAEFKVQMETTKGSFVVAVHRDWAPKGVDRFYNLVKIGFYDDIAFFRAVPGFVAQFGIHGNPAVTQAWSNSDIQDDPVKHSNTKGTLTFATSGPNSRTTQLFISYEDNTNLDGMGFAAFGEVVAGIDVVGKLYTGYGEGAPRGRGPDQGMITHQGNEYLKKGFPKLDYIVHATIVP